MKSIRCVRNSRKKTGESNNCGFKRFVCLWSVI